MTKLSLCPALAPNAISARKKTGKGHPGTWQTLSVDLQGRGGDGQRPDAPGRPARPYEIAEHLQRHLHRDQP